MKLSTRGRYGVRAMVDLSVHYNQGPVPVRKIAERMEVSTKYLDHLMSSLRVAGLIRNIRKANRGYVLARPPEEIKLSEVIYALEGSLAPADCVDDAGTCNRTDVCATRDLWKQLKEAINDVLSSLTLEDMVRKQKQKEKENCNPLMYSI